MAGNIPTVYTGCGACFQGMAFCGYGAIIPFGLMLPFEFVADTITLPYDIFKAKD